jgi:hypothetical protein
MDGVLPSDVHCLRSGRTLLTIELLYSNGGQEGIKGTVSLV